MWIYKWRKFTKKLTFEREQSYRRGVGNSGEVTPTPVNNHWIDIYAYVEEAGVGSGMGSVPFAKYSAAKQNIC